MQTKEYEVSGKSRNLQKLILCVNSLLSILTLILIFLVACKSSYETEYLYKVQSGDSLESISEISGVKAGSIIDYNELETENLTSGQELYLPGVSKLKRGEQLQQISVTSREDWKALKAGTMPDAGSFYRITVHHTTDNPKFPKKNNAVFARVVQKYHQNERKWADIAYHYLVAKDGEILEGRLMNKLGAHVKNHNKGNIGIALLGDFERDEMPDKQKQALKSLIQALQERFNISRNELYGHNDLRDTSCPGKNALAFVNSLKEE